MNRQEYIKKGLHILLIVLWMVLLSKAESYYCNYVLVGVIGIISILAKKEYSNAARSVLCEKMLPAVLALAVVIANYKLYSDMDNLLVCVVKFVATLVCGYITFGSIMTFAVAKTAGLVWKKFDYAFKPVTVFGASAVGLTVVYSLVWFLGFYPGVLTPDSLNQMNQIFTGAYTNHHPYYYTMLIKFFVDIGQAIFHNINTGVAMYSLFQIIAMASAFSYMIMTLYQMKLSWKWLVAVFIWFLLPYHIYYSFHMMKDCLFGAAVLVVITSMFRLINVLSENRILDYVLLTTSGFVMCIFRSNGMLAFVIMLAAFVFLYGKKHPKMLVLLLALLICTYTLKHPVLEHLGVPQPDTIESLSIPAQQIARVVVEGEELTDEQYELLSQVIEVEKIAETYDPDLSDPIKNLVRATGNQGYFGEHIPEFIKLYIELGLKHLDHYIAAFIDQTVGYWNGGYDNYIWGYQILENDFGLFQTIFFEFIRKCFRAYARLFKTIPVLQPFVSIGLTSWILLGLGVISISQKRKNGFFIIPILAIILTLLVATPVAAEFRYAYASYTCLPFLVFAVLSNTKDMPNAIEA